jgi:hypothetical protein
MKQSEDDIEVQLLPIWPHAGKALGYRTRSAAYDAVARGDIRTVKLGKKILRVPKRWLDRMVSGDEAA